MMKATFPIILASALLIHTSPAQLVYSQQFQNGNTGIFQQQAGQVSQINTGEFDRKLRLALARWASDRLLDTRPGDPELVGAPQLGT